MLNGTREVTLIGASVSYDAIGQPVKTDVETTVIADVSSVTRAEWTSANQLGLYPEFKLNVWEHEYTGQEYVLIGGNRYHIYRTFTNGDMVELYCERMVGYE
ncbi:MAG: hypothetical protein IKE02_03680 [Lachnospiraceae bacterium]|nr:hypothetical protein [Lachnospiraceae bacterium]